MDTRRHRIQIYTPLSVIDGEIDTREGTRLSDYLRSREGDTLIVHNAAVIYTDGSSRDGARVDVTARNCLAVIDLEPAVKGEAYMRIATKPVRIEVSYATGLRIEGDIHLSESVEYDNVMAGLSQGNSLRVLTNAVIRLGGLVVSEGDTVLTDLLTAVHFIQITSAPAQAAAAEAPEATPAAATDVFGATPPEEPRQLLFARS